MAKRLPSLKFKEVCLEMKLVKGEGLDCNAHAEFLSYMQIKKDPGEAEKEEARCDSFEMKSVQRSHSRESWLDEFRVYSSNLKRDIKHEATPEQPGRGPQSIKAFESSDNREMILLFEYKGPKNKPQSPLEDANGLGDLVLFSCALRFQTVPWKGSHYIYIYI
ncbi:Hypothetical protein FKW44_022321 [Caligus rogercresseyi]|uniref:Uncharacterized protein n=1 Tax=Caligus rogercresseyi TaxID=217165 RepID=A0A7T8JX17_CALRO|nr:Hypothetical protein FKW44_022321 [Caligus rogercresseyi]